MLPQSVVKLLKSTRFLHLATCSDNVPHVSLMNYTFYQDNGENYIIVTTPVDTTKYQNILNNNKVSMLVHDWMQSKTEEDNGDGKRRNSLYEMITNLNKTEISSVSVMIDGEASIIDPNNKNYKLLKSLHLNNETIDQSQIDNYVRDDTNALILVNINKCKITDTNNNVEEY